MDEKKISSILLVVIILVFVITFTFYLISINRNETFPGELMNLDNSYIGDAPAVGHILNASGISYDSFSLETSARPFRIIVNYLSPLDDKKIYEELVYCSTLIFSLIQNVDEICYSSFKQDLVINREQINKLYSMDVADMGNKREDFLTTIPSMIKSGEDFKEFFNSL